MLNDSVREELALKITPRSRTEQSEEVQLELPKQIFISAVKNELVKISAPPVELIENNTPPTPVVNRSHTAEIFAKPTSQTLVGFQNKNATLPDWRLQLQNSVRKRLDEQKSGGISEAQIVQPAAPRRITPVTNGATALKTEIIEENQPVQTENPAIANALRRIEESRKKYLAPENPIEVETNEAPPTVKQFPTVLPNKSLSFLPKQDQEQLTQPPPKPNVVKFSLESKPEQRVEKVEKYDTAKLPPLPLPAKISSSFDKKPEPKKIELNLDSLDYIEDIHRTAPEGKKQPEPEIIEHIEESDEAEDYAPISLRFNAAIFDLLIGSFLSLVLLSPFMLLNGKFFSLEGFFAFLATCAIVMFIYMTTTIGFLGRTFGMRLFALEIIDIEENDYPTLHQAAVSSSVYLISLAFGGLGFLPMLVNSEKRAAHDLLSKTIVVKEY